MSFASASIPPVYVERFVQAYQAFLSQVRLAIEAVREEQSIGSQEAAAEWERRVLPLLEERFHSVQAAVSKLGAGDASELVQRADDATGLSKNLDLFPLDFAGTEQGEALRQKLSLVIVTAYQVCNVAGLL